MEGTVMAPRTPVITAELDNDTYQAGGPVTCTVEENLNPDVQRTFAFTGIDPPTQLSDDTQSVVFQWTAAGDGPQTVTVQMTRTSIDGIKWQDGAVSNTVTLDYTVEGDDEPPPSALFPIGTSFGKGNWGGLTGWQGHRAYITGSCPSDITSFDRVRESIADGAKTMHLSWKDTNQTNVARMLDSFTRLPDDYTITCSYFHEMEDNMNGSTFLRDFTPQRVLAQERGIAFGPMYQAYTMNPQSGRNWREWWDDESDFFGFEAYNPGRKKTPPIFEPPSQFLDRGFAVLEEVDKPTIAGEFGMPVDPRSAATRPAYIKAIIQYYIDNCPMPSGGGPGCLGVYYWDSVVSNDNRLDRAAAEALQSFYE